MHQRRKRLKKQIRAWLQAERAGDERQAELALRLAFSRLPVPTPSRDLVAGTLERLGLTAHSLPVRVPGRAFKALVSSCLAAAGVALAVVPQAVTPWLLSLRPSWVIDWWTAILVGASQRLAGGLAVWRVLQSVGETLAGALATPTALGALAVAVLVSFATFRALSGLVSLERSA